MHTECLCQLLMSCVVSHSDVWILSGQVEFLPLDLQRTDKSDELDEDGCKIGLARIREALECVQWPAMVMGSAAPAGRGLASQMEGPNRTVDVDPIEEQGEDLSGYRAFPTPTDMEPAQEEEAASQAEVPVEEEDSISALDADFERENEEPNIDMDEMERMFSEVARVREAGKNLPDDERRRRAGAAALSLMNMLGGMESDEEEPQPDTTKPFVGEVKATIELETDSDE